MPSRVSFEAVLVDVAHGPVADLLVDGVRGRIVQICEQEHEAPACAEEILGERRYTSGRIATTTEMRWRVHGTDPDAVRCRTPETGDADGLGVPPHAQAATASGQSKVD